MTTHVDMIGKDHVCDENEILVDQLEANAVLASEGESVNYKLTHDESDYDDAA